MNVQNLKETQDKVYQEVKQLLKEFSAYSSQEDFINNLEKIKNFSEKISELKIYNSVSEFLFDQTNTEETVERDAINFEIDTKQIIDIQEDVLQDEQLGKQESTEGEAINSEKIDEQYFLEKDKEQISISNKIQNEENEELEQIASLKNEIELHEEENRLHEERRKIIDLEKPSKKDNSVESIDIQETTPHSKKFKLSHIKGLSIVQSLFDDDHLANIPEAPKEETLAKSTSLQKNNMPTDYLEAEKQLPDFKLDINDKIAFTKVLFGGSQVELNTVVSKLNSFKKLEQAKDYLSDVYYERNWKNADEYAQRLWSLVENKFL